MKIVELIGSFRVRLMALLLVLLGLTLGVQYYVNLRAARSNAHMIVEQEEAIMAGVALGVSSISQDKYLDQIRNEIHQPLLDEQTGRVRNVLVVDSDGNIRDSLTKAQNPQENDDGTVTFKNVSQLSLPPLSSAVEYPDGNEPLPPWATTASTARAEEPAAFYLSVETTQGKRFVIVVLGAGDTLTNILELQASRLATYTLVLLLITTVITAMLVWRFTRPIKSLSIAARRIAGGDFTFRVPADRLDEMGALATAFNEMTARLARARELEAQLHQAEKGAVVGRLAAAIAHEIRNPLNYINLTLDHLRSSFAPSDPARRETFIRLTDQLKAEVARINRHISDFLKYSRPSTLDLQQIDLRAEAEDALRLVAAQAAERNIQTSVELNGPVPIVVADRESLRSVFTNLLVNGFQAIDGDGGKVEIRLSTDPDTERARIDVSDTGRGIAPEDIAKVFEPYYSTKETGTGLGLAIVRKAIDDHGGSVNVTSKQGSGTTFTITLPVNQTRIGHLDQ